MSLCRQLPTTIRKGVTWTTLVHSHLSEFATCSMMFSSDNDTPLTDVWRLAWLFHGLSCCPKDKRGSISPSIFCNKLYYVNKFPWRYNVRQCYILKWINFAPLRKKSTTEGLHISNKRNFSFDQFRGSGKEPKEGLRAWNLKLINFVATAVNQRKGDYDNL